MDVAYGQMLLLLVKLFSGNKGRYTDLLVIFGLKAVICRHNWFLVFPCIYSLTVGTGILGRFLEFL